MTIKLNAVLGGSYQRYIAEDFLCTEFFNKRIPLIIDCGSNARESDFENKIKAKLLDVYGDVSVACVFNGIESSCLVSDLKPFETIIVDSFTELTSRKRFDFSDLVEIMKKLRAENGCEWDRAQTHESIRINLIEEAYELVEAIDCNDKAMILEETGDVLMQSVFHTEMAEEYGEFDFADMLSGLCRKLIDRHTHIFGENHASNSEEALAFWTEAKKKEKKYASSSDAMNRVPKNLPALLYAEKIQKVAKKSGLYVIDAQKAWCDLCSAAEKFKTAEDDKKAALAGELLFKLVDLLRIYKIEPEMALHEKSLEFLSDFAELENKGHKN